MSWAWSQQLGLEMTKSRDVDMIKNASLEGAGCLRRCLYFRHSMPKCLISLHSKSRQNGLQNGMNWIDGINPEEELNIDSLIWKGVAW